MTNKDLALKIFQELKLKGSMVSNTEIFTIENTLDKYNPEKEWQKLALAGKRDEAIRSLWLELCDDKTRNIEKVTDIVDMYMSAFR